DWIVRAEGQHGPRVDDVADAPGPCGTGLPEAYRPVVAAVGLRVVGAVRRLHARGDTGTADQLNDVLRHGFDVLDPVLRARGRQAGQSLGDLTNATFSDRMRGGGYAGGVELAHPRRVVLDSAPDRLGALALGVRRLEPGG